MTTQEISVLLVGSQCADIERLLHHTRWRVSRAISAAEARATLKRVPVQVVLCPHTLGDGTGACTHTISQVNGDGRCGSRNSVAFINALF
jgi:hypothetical protein